VTTTSRVVAIACTHGHDDHVRFAPDLGHVTGAPVLLNPAEAEVWALTHDSAPDGELVDGAELAVAGTTLRVIATPGHSPGGVCLYAPDLGVLFTGDTLFNGGPGATGRSFSDRDLLVSSIRERLFTLPDDTVVHTGHGDDTTLGAERANV
jgi:glyoxylase-like metal-dependent hydrolase (beta-lactamase superfamily II)